MDSKRCEVAFDQDNGIPYIVKYIDYKYVDKNYEVELYDPMTGDRVHNFKLLMEHLDQADYYDNHSNYRFPVVIKKG